MLLTPTKIISKLKKCYGKNNLLTTKHAKLTIICILDIIFVDIVVVNHVSIQVLRML